MPEAVWFESRHHSELIDLRIVVPLCFGGWNVADGFEGGHLDGFEAAPRAASMDHLGLVEAVDGCCQTNANRSQFARESRSSGRAEQTPLIKGGGSVELEIIPTVEVAFLIEVVMD